MFRANVFEVKAKLSEYLDRAARGERIVICRHNTPVAELRAVEAVRREPRPIGPLPGRPRFDVPPSFFEPLPADELDLWEGVGAADPLAPPMKPRAVRGATKVAEAKAQYGKPAGRGRGAGRRRS
ncbi:MAG: type II toxin-antitoxin system prevent-host-death family antitoxin [Vicinamibacterales bacterium]